MNWTQALPTKSGYYWFAMQHGDIPLCLYFEADRGVIETYGYFYNDSLRCSGSEGYYFSDDCVEVLDWEHE